MKIYSVKRKLMPLNIPSGKPSALDRDNIID
jgi:hypothetical protein